MANKQQTAVQMLIESFEKTIGKSIILVMQDEINQAIQMNREQIEQAFIKGNEFVPKWKINGVPYIESEQYYEQTYGTEPSH